jgi:poly(hydroxyalkanoate) granule-associated protein
MSILKNTILASIGAFHVTRDKAEKIIDDLIKKGELDKSDRKKAIMELLQKAEKSTAEVRKQFAEEADKVSDKVKKAAAGLNWATQDDFRKLESKVNKLSKQIKELTEKLQQQKPTA